MSDYERFGSLDPDFEQVGNCLGCPLQLSSLYTKKQHLGIPKKNYFFVHIAQTLYFLYFLSRTAGNENDSHLIPSTPVGIRAVRAT